jgi:hypothetical protein
MCCRSQEITDIGILAGDTPKEKPEVMTQFAAVAKEWFG